MAPHDQPGMMPRKQKLEWPVASVSLLLYLPMIFMGLYVVGFFFSSRFLLELASSVFPIFCSTEGPSGVCSPIDGWPRWWSVPVWLVVAGVFGRAVVGRLPEEKYAAGTVVICVVVAAFRVLAAMAGFGIWVGYT